MADSTEVIDGIINSGGEQATTANELFEALSKALLYGRRASTTDGINWGYYGGKPTTPYGALLTVAHSTLTLDVSATNYIVANKWSGVVSATTAKTNWDDTVNYWRLYSVVVGAATITSYVDYREIGKMTGGRNNELLAPVTKTGSFTVADGEDRIICNGSGSISITLPSVSSYKGRSILVKTIAAYTVVSAASDVKPIDTDTAGTAILAATAGKWAELVSDGTNWVVMGGN